MGAFIRFKVTPAEHVQAGGHTKRKGAAMTEMTKINGGFGPRQACQAANPSQCSDCALAYDCVRARSGRPWAWGVVALVALAGFALLA